MTGARDLLKTLLAHDIDVCFANPGTSEMHFVAALDEVPKMHGVLALFEGVATGAADGYARIAGRPAAVLLHLGPGLGNGLANLHNARRAGTPVVVVVGDHATYHKPYDAPLESDIDALARTVSVWTRRARRPEDIADDVEAAVRAACEAPGGVATLILPADVSWSPTMGPTSNSVDPPGLGDTSRPAPFERIDRVANVLRAHGDCTLILLGAEATREPALSAADRIRTATGATILCETFPARLERGAGRPAFDRLGYFAEQASAQLAGVRHLVLAGARSPVSFFAYPSRPSDLIPDGCGVHKLAAPGDNAESLVTLADILAPDVSPTHVGYNPPAAPRGPLTAQAVADVVGALLPQNAIVVDESNTAGAPLPEATRAAATHDWLTLTGGSIGYGLPAATGAAVAAPDRPVLCLQADGSAMYTLSALWTQAREQLDVTTVIYNNGAYDILRLELARVGAVRGAPGPQASSLLSLRDPALDFVSLATGLGVPAERATTGEELAAAIAQAFAEPGPHLIEAMIPPLTI